MRESLCSRGRGDSMREHLCSRVRGRGDSMRERLCSRGRGRGDSMRESLCSRGRGRGDSMRERLCSRGRGDSMREHLCSRGKLFTKSDVIIYSPTCPVVFGSRGCLRNRSVYLFLLLIKRWR